MVAARQPTLRTTLFRTERKHENSSTKRLKYRRVSGVLQYIVVSTLGGHDVYEADMGIEHGLGRDLGIGFFLNFVYENNR